MRIWSLHPKHLDQKGLVALWRETLLAQKVLQGLTKGYKNHPQLERFKQQPDPVQAISTYLHHVADEADRRGYNFNRSKIVKGREEKKIAVSTGQIGYELGHLFNKLFDRDPDKYKALKELQDYDVHPLFTRITGPVESWEKV